MTSLQLLLRHWRWGAAHQFAVWAAFSMTAATSLGCRRNIGWLPGSSSVSDFALPAMNRSSSGLIWRSFCGITAKLGFFDHAATVTLASKEAAAIGTCEIAMKWAVAFGTPPAKSLANASGFT